jgi:hypothetical protein
VNAWMCGRCKTATNAGNVDDPPENWRYIHQPIRGSQGARSRTQSVICDKCDDELYEWWKQ